MRKNWEPDEEEDEEDDASDGPIIAHKKWNQ
jgi:hypothetical protein